MRSIAQLSDMVGRTAVVTGGAGHLGRAMASALHELGSTVVLVDRDQASLADAATALAGPAHDRIKTQVIDLEDEAQRDGLATSISRDFGCVDVLINNAGFVGTSNLNGWAVSFEDQSVSTWRRALEVNLTAPFHLSQALAPALRASGHGAIINVSSIYGILGPDWDLYTDTKMGNPAAYGASKGGLLQLTRWLSTTLAPDVRVNSISPGGLARGQAQSFVDRYVSKTPLARMGREEDFKGVVAFLATDLSAWVTGQNIIVDGGWSAW